MSASASDKVITEKTVYAVTGPSLHASSREYVSIVFLAASVFLFLSLLSHDPRDPSFNAATTRLHVSNLCGLLGSYVADALLQLLGVCAILLPVVLVLLALNTFMRKQWSLSLPAGIAFVLLILCMSALLERLPAADFFCFPSKAPGGALGTILHKFLERFLGSAGELVIIAATTVLCVLYISKTSLAQMVRLVFPASLGLARFAQPVLGWITPQLLSIFKRSPIHGSAVLSSLPQISQTFVTSAEHHDSCNDSPCHDSLDKGLMGVRSWERLSFLPEEEPEESLEDKERCRTSEAMGPQSGSRIQNEEINFHLRFPWKSLEIPKDNYVRTLDHDTLRDNATGTEGQEDRPVPAGMSYNAGIQGSSTISERSVGRPIRVSKRADEQIHKSTPMESQCFTRDDYQFPPIDLLDTPQIIGRSIDESFLADNAKTLQQKLADLGIQGDVVEIHPGPVITMYELSLASGIPLRKVLSTSDDLAMALKSGSTRVVAPIHGKDTVGIEVPNRDREIVYFREIIESETFGKSTAPLKVALGKKIDGEPFATSLTKMPHLMIAGATGTGKSVGLNCLICSWLMSCHPDDVKFLMVDPKKLELSYYQDIPHLIHPVVTDPEKVPRVLGWAIKEMERRYELLSKAGAKNIESYNQQVVSGSLAPLPDSLPWEKLPYIIIIVDELAELMMVAAKDIEISIARLAQMARASGIHLILATQRPSVDVITGVIKANFPTRISYQVSAKPDSRTILDTTGAENLLGMGDMLFLPPGAAKLVRLHGAYVSESEIRRIVDFIKAQRSPVYLQEIVKHVTDEDAKTDSADFIEDEKYVEAVELVTRLGHASISLIQRHMRIGYNRAARIIEVMEAEGIIGPSDGTSRPREVLVRSLESVPNGGGTALA